MESLQLVVNHPWFGFICKSRPRFYCTVSVTSRPWITLRGTRSSLETLSTLPRPVRPIFSKISDKLISISSCVIFQSFQEAMVTLEKQSFSDPTGKKRYTMPGATTFSFNQTRQFEMDFIRSLSTLEQMSIGARFLDIDVRGCLNQHRSGKRCTGLSSCQPRLHLKVRWDTVSRISHPVINATCIALLDTVPCQTERNFIIYLSFLNWDWLLIREVQWFYWTQKLLVPVEKFTVRMSMVRLELATPGLQIQCSSHWATRAQKLLLGRSWVYPVGVLHHYIFIISQLRLTSHPRSTVVLLDTETPGTSREIYSEDADGETRTRNPWITNPVL